MSKSFDISRAPMGLQLDANTAWEDLSIRPFIGCVNTGKSTCAVYEICLLHAPHEEKAVRSSDVFLVVQRIEPTVGKPKYYKRIGLWRIIDKSDTVRTCAHIPRGRIESRVEVLWLF